MEHLVPLPILDIIHLYIFDLVHYLRSPLSYGTLIFYLMRNLYLYNAYIYTLHFIFTVYFYRCRASHWQGGVAANRHWKQRRVHDGCVDLRRSSEAWRSRSHHCMRRSDGIDRKRIHDNCTNTVRRSHEHPPRLHVYRTTAACTLKDGWVQNHSFGTDNDITMYIVNKMLFSIIVLFWSPYHFLDNVSKLPRVWHSNMPETIVLIVR